MYQQNKTEKEGLRTLQRKTIISKMALETLIYATPAEGKGYAEIASKII